MPTYIGTSQITTFMFNLKKSAAQSEPNQARLKNDAVSDEVFTSYKYLTGLNRLI